MMSEKFKLNCNSFGLGWDKDAKDCLKCKEEFSDEYTKCKKKTLSEKGVKRVSVVKLCENLVSQGKSKEEAVIVMTNRCVEKGLDEKAAKWKADSTWHYVNWKIEKGEKKSRQDGGTKKD